MNCRIIAIHLIILLLILPTLLPADNYRRYDVRTGLSGNCVRSILQDRTGYMWFATQDGLCRFNGSEFTQFGKDDNTDKPRNLNIIRILEHADGRRIWIATVEGLYRFDTDTERFEHFDKSTASGETIPSTFDMAYDHDGQLWIASGDGLFRYDEEHDRLVRYSLDSDKAARSLPGNHVWTIYVDRQGAVWVGTRGGLCRYNPHSDNFVTFRADNEAPFGRPLGNEILSITADATDNIWVGSWNDGIARLNPTNNRLHYYFGEGDSLFIPRVRTLYTPDNEGRLYAGSDDGFFVVNTSTLRCRQSTQRFADESIYHIAADREGGLWLGTYFGGAIYLSPKYRDIEWYYADAAPHGLSGNVVSQFCEEPSGKIWIATEDGGLNRFDPHTQRFEHFLTAPGNSEPCYRNLHALLWDGGRLWVGSFSHGLYLLNPATRATRCYRSDPQRPESTLPNDHIYSLLRSKGGTLFVGTMSGLARYDDRLDQFATIPSTRRIHVYDLAEDADGRIWIADKRDGVWSYNPRTDSLRHYPHNPQDPTTPAGNSVIRIAADSRGDLWFTAETGGICRYRPESDDFETLGVRQGLPNSVIYGMLDDGNGVFWLSSNEGLVRYEPRARRAQFYTTDDGLQSPQFNYRSSLRASDGTLYFGGVNGFNRLDPMRQHIVTTAPVASISTLTLYDTSKPDEGPSRLPVLGKSEVSIPHTVSTVEITLDALSYVAPGKNRFAYKMEGLQDKWVTTSRNRVSFMGLPPGDYTFRLRACNGDGYWSTADEILKISILPPPWLTIPAKLCYLLLIAALLFLVGRNLNRRERKRREQLVHEQRLAHEQELYQAKIAFFTQIAHEIKTPLTLIQAPLEAVIRARRWDETTEERLDIIHQNANRLMELIKQLLDFRKIDKEGYRLTLHPLDVEKHLRQIAERFDSGEPDAPKLSLTFAQSPLIYNLDSEALTKIVSNLLVNALKHTRSRIELEAGETTDDAGRRRLRIAVSDDGPGIPSEEQTHVFEPFYQGSADKGKTSGVGIGLSLVRLLVEKHEGSIRIDDSYRDGCRIVVELPYLEAECAEPASETSAVVHEDKPAATEPIDEPNVVLIVEDTAEMRSFLAQSLGETYTVLTAVDGEDALEVLRSHSVDLVVTDIMMPRLDGFGLLQAIRADRLLSQTPVILLSALDNVDSKIRALDYGADSYLDKPFSLRQLEATIDNLLESRKRMLKHFESNPTAPYAQIVKSPADLRWMERVDEIIIANFTNEAFSIDMLADKLAISRSNLQRKLKAITGMTPGDHIKSVRLKSAARMLAEGGYRINEVCFLVGFGSPSYFARCFHRQFGVLPKDYVGDK